MNLLACSLGFNMLKVMIDAIQGCSTYGDRWVIKIEYF